VAVLIRSVWRHVTSTRLSGGEELAFFALVRSRQLSRVYRLPSDPRLTDRSISSVAVLGSGDFSYFPSSSPAAVRRDTVGDQAIYETERLDSSVINECTAIRGLTSVLGTQQTIDAAAALSACWG